MALQTIEANKFRRISAHIEPEQEGLACLHLFSRHVVLAVVSDRAAQRLVVLPDRPAVQCTRFLLYIHTRCECVSVEQTCGPIRTENAQWHHSLSTHAFNVMPTDQIKSPLIFAMGGKRKGGVKGASYHHGHKYVGSATLPCPHAGKDMGAKLAKIKLAKNKLATNKISTQIAPDMTRWRRHLGPFCWLATPAFRSLTSGCVQGPRSRWRSGGF